MNRPCILLLTLTVLVGATSGPAIANIPDLALCWAEMTAPANTMLLNRLDGLGNPFTSAQDPTGVYVNATITVWLRDANDDPVVGYPPEDLWLVTSNGSLAACPDGTVADSATDQNGMTSWVQPMKAGGCTHGETTHVVVAGTMLAQPGFSLWFASIDFNGDLLRNLTDVVLLAQMYFSGNYEPCIDFYHDGLHNLSDLPFYAQSYHGGECP